MGHHLNGFAQIVPAPLFFDDGGVDLSGGEVVFFREGGVDKAFVVADVQIGLAPIGGDKNFAVLDR